MKLQLALDLVTLNEALAILKEVHDLVDIVEVGTPWIVREGVAPLKAIRAAFPDATLLADTKIMDAGRQEALYALEAGADIVTVLGVADDATIRAATAEAHRLGRKILADMINVSNLERRAREIDRLGVDSICVHTGFDVQCAGRTPVEELRLVSRAVSRRIVAAAGGVNLANIAAVAAERPAVVIIGGGITGQPNKREVAAKMREILRQKENEHAL